MYIKQQQTLSLVKPMSFPSYNLVGIQFDLWYKATSICSIPQKYIGNGHIK